MADTKSKYKEEDSKKELLDKIKSEGDLRLSITDQVKATELQQRFAHDIDLATRQIFDIDLKDLEENAERLALELQASTEDIITATSSGYNVSGNLRYSNLLFKPLHNYPSFSGYPTRTKINEIAWVHLPTVTIYAHTLSAPEFGIVDQLILVKDVTGDGYGFEETLNTYSDSTSTFNTGVNFGNVVSEVRLDRRIFKSKGCYADPRNYELSYASGHQEIIKVLPPSPCNQSSSLRVKTENINYSGWEHSYCSSEDYKSRYRVDGQYDPSLSGFYQNIIRCVSQGTNNTPETTKFTSNSIGLLSHPSIFGYNVSTLASFGESSPGKGDCAIEAQRSLGLNPNDYLNGNTEYGAPLQINEAQVSKFECVITRKASLLSMDSGMPHTAYMGITQSPYTGLNYIETPETWFNFIAEEGQQSLLDSSGNEMMLTEGTYGVIREYAYSENLNVCGNGSSLEIEVCLDAKSPSYYLTTELDCNGTSITNYINGTNGSWTPIEGPEGCCGVDCSNFNMEGFNSPSVFGGSTGTIIIDFGGGLGNPDTSANEHSYDVSLTHSAGTAITQNGNAAYSSGAAITDSTCDTVNESSIVSCNSNVSITVGMEVTGTGIDGTAYVGAITGGQPGAATEFQLSSNPSFNIPVNASSSNTNTTLTFSIGTSFFVWGSLPANSGGDYYEITVTDDSGCIYSQIITIGEGPESVGCLNSNSINYLSTYNSQCVPDCCIICNDTTGYMENNNGSFLGNPFITLNASSLETTTSSATDGAITLNGGISPSLLAYLVSSMSYKYTLHELSSSGDFDSAGGILGTTTSTLEQGITSSFTGLGYGYYAIQVQIEDSATGSDANLEKCFQWVSVNVLANVCQEKGASNFNSTVPYDLAIPNSSICTYEEGCNCEPSVEIIPEECGIKLRANISCSAAGPVSWRWIHPNGDILFEESFPYVLPNSFVDSLNSNLITESGAYIFELTDGGGSGSCVTIVTTNVNLPVCGCMDALAINYNPIATVDNNSCQYCQYGCTDPEATNYSSIATCDDGSCFTPYGGCTDPTASNYDPTSNVDDGSCLYRGCMDQTALNYLHDCEGVYNPNININSPQCCTYCSPPSHSKVQVTDASILTGCIANNDGEASTRMYESTSSQFYDWVVLDSYGVIVYTVSNVAAEVTSTTGAILPVGVYTYIITDSNGCTVNGRFVVGNSSEACGCTDPVATNYSPTATTDDGSCYRPGCTDPIATNYNPNTTIDDGSCAYTITPNPCQLTSDTQKKIDNKIFGCLTLKGATYLNKIRIGYSDDCSVMNQWKLVLVNYLLHKKELDCMYNCSDAMTPSPVGPSTCGELWVTGGTSTGVNDQSYAGSTTTTGEGTSVTDPDLYFVQGNTLSKGDVIKMPSGLIWEMVASEACSFGCYNPEERGAAMGNWAQCTSLNNFTNTATTNYIDPFIRFMNEQCDKCTEDPKCTESALRKPNNN